MYDVEAALKVTAEGVPCTSAGGTAHWAHCRHQQFLQQSSARGHPRLLYSVISGGFAATVGCFWNDSSNHVSKVHTTRIYKDRNCRLDLFPFLKFELFCCFSSVFFYFFHHIKLRADSVCVYPLLCAFILTHDNRAKEPNICILQT